MAYVVVVFCLINVLALGAVGYILLAMTHDVGVIIQSAIQEEVRKQDDRIEKRLAKSSGKVETDPEELELAPTDGLRAGRAFRR